MKLYFQISLILIIAFLPVSESCFSANISDSHNKESIKDIMQKVADWQIQNFTYKKNGSGGYLHDYGIDAWTNATLYMGMARWAKTSDNPDIYYKWLYDIGSKNKWKIPSNFKKMLYHADEFCIGQFYLDMYDVYKQKKIIKSTRQRIDWILKNPPKPEMIYKNKQSWTWCDALFMAPQVYAHLSILCNDNKYMEFMDQEFKKTYEHLYNKDEKLFFRDDSYLEKRESNGEKIFWGRGNGWVAAGIANLLRIIPQESEYRPFYENLFCELTGKLATMQDENGFWHASLLDPASYPSPETSATALITYALSYGINNGLLNRDEYLPATNKAWQALISAVGDDGKLGWVQPIGADPKNVTRDMTAVYGVGAFLLAGTEMYKLTDNKELSEKEISLSI